MVEDGFAVFDVDPDVRRWAAAACETARALTADPAHRAAHMRYADTWFVGVDALPNGADGSIGGVPLRGPWPAQVTDTPSWHPAQLSVVYPGYPAPDPSETAGQQRLREQRFAAHVDGLLPEGPDRRRYLREPHGFILGLPLNNTPQGPLMVWPGSQRIIGAALRDAVGTRPPEEVDLTDAYQAARRFVFDRIAPRPILTGPGQSILLHRHMLHGVAPWPAEESGPAEGRMIAYFRPQIPAKDWLRAD